MVRAMLIRPDAAHAELRTLEVKVTRRPWNAALHPRDSKGRFIETGGTVRLWGGQLARVVRALPNDRILVQDQTGPNEFKGRRHTTSAKWVSMVARPDGSAPTENEDKVQEEDDKRAIDPRRGNGVAHDDDGDPNTPNAPHTTDDRGRPIGEDDDPVGPREDDDQDEPADGKHPVHVRALGNSSNGPSRFRDTAAVRQHFLDLAERPGTSPDMAQFLRSVAGEDDDLHIAHGGRLLALRDDSTGRWYLTATGTGQRMNEAGEFGTPEEALEFARKLNSDTGGSPGRSTGFDFSDPDLDETARTWRSPQGENIQAAIKRSREEFDGPQTPDVPPAGPDAPETVSRSDLKPGDRIKVTVNAGDLEWPASTRDQDKPETVTVEGTVAPTHSEGRWTPLLDATLTGPDGTVMASGDSARLMRTPARVEVSGHSEGHDTEPVPASRVRVGDVVAGGEFGHVVTRIRRGRGSRTFTTRDLGGSRGLHQFGAAPDDTVHIVPRTRRRPEDVAQDTPVTQQHTSSDAAKNEAAAVMMSWHRLSEHAATQWPDGAPEAFRTLAQHMQNVTNTPKGAAGYQRVADAMHGGLAALEELDTSELDSDLAQGLHRLHDQLDENADRFAADARAIAERKRQKDTAVNADAQPVSNPNLTTAQASALVDALRNPASSEGRQLDAPSPVAQVLIRHGYAEQRRKPSATGGWNTYFTLTPEGERRAKVLERERNGTPQADSPEAGPARPAADAPAEPLRHSWDDPESLVTLTMPEALADFLNVDETAAMEDPDTRKALTEATRGRGGTLKVTAPIETHRALLEWAWALAGGEGLESDPKEVRAYNNYTKRVDEAAAQVQARRAERDAHAPSPDAPDSADGEAAPDVTLSPDEVNAPAAAARAAKAPSGMDDGEIRDEIVSLMEREMADGELSGTDRTRMRVLEAEEARRAGRAPKREEPKRTAPAPEADGMFDVAPDEQQRFVADPNNPDDVADDATGTPDMFADAEGRDTSRLRAPESRKPADFKDGDRFVDADGRTHTVQGEPIRTPRGRIRVVDTDGGEHFLAPDKELRVLHEDEDAPEAPEANAPDAGTPAADATDETPAPDAGTPSTGSPDAPDAAPDSEPDANQVSIDHSGTGTTVRFPTPNGRVDDIMFAALRSMGFKASRDRSQGQFFYLPSNMKLSTRAERVRRLEQYLERQNVAFHRPHDTAEGPELSPEQLEQLKGRYRAPAGTWAVTDFQPGDEVWTGSRWDTVDSVGPKNLRLQSWGTTSFDSVLARRRGGEIRTMFDEPADDGTPRPGTADPVHMRDEAIDAELTHLRGATLPQGNEPTARTVRRQVSARIHALESAKSHKQQTRLSAERGRRDRSDLARDPERIARLKGQQVQGRDGAPIGVVYQYKKGKWVFVDRDGRMPMRGEDPMTYPSRAAAITKLTQLADHRNERAGDGWNHSAWDDVQAGDTIRLPELTRQDNGRRAITGWSEPLEVSGIRRDSTGQVFVTGRRDGEDVELEVPSTDASFGTSKPGTMPDRERGDAGGGMDWRQMRPEDFGQDEAPAPAANQNEPRPDDETGTPDLFSSSTPEGDSPNGNAPDSGSPEGDGPESSTSDDVAPPAPVGDASPQSMSDDEIAAEFDRLEAWRQRHVVPSGEGPRIQGPAVLALSPMANRKRELKEEQNKREAARRATERREREKQEMADAVARATVGEFRGRQNAGGYYPVSLDGEQVGTVRKVVGKWQYEHADGTSSELFNSKNEAIGRLVKLVDVRREMDEHRAKEAERRARAEEEAAQRARTQHGPAYSPELRVRMASISDDIATVRGLEGIEDQDRIQRLAELVRRVEDGHTDDLQRDLRHILAETEWLDGQFHDMNLPYETRRKASWASAANRKMEDVLAHPDFQDTREPDAPDGPDGASDEVTRAQALLGEGMNAVGGDSLPEMQELRDRLDRADTADDRDAELHDIADRMDALAEQYELAGPHGEHAADRFRSAARAARGENDDSNNRQADDSPRRVDGVNRDGQDDDTSDGTTGDDTPENDDEQQNNPDDNQNDNQDDGENGRQRRDGDADGAGPDGGPDGDGAGAPGDGDGGDSGDGGDGGDGPDGDPDAPDPDDENDGENDDEREDNDRNRRRRRRRNNRGGGGTGGPGGGGLGGPGLPHLNFPDSNAPTGTGGDGDGSDGPNRGHSDRPDVGNPNGTDGFPDGEGNLPPENSDDQSDEERERIGNFTLPEDLTALDDSELEAAMRQGLSQRDMTRMMVELDRRDGFVDERIRSAVPDTPPADADDAEQRGRDMDAALGFGSADVTRPSPASPDRLRQEYDNLDEERFQAAMQATGGRMLSPEAEAQGIDPRAVFSGNKYSNKRAKELASPELRHWFDGDDDTVGNGRLTLGQYRAREADRVLRAEFADWDEARYRQALDFTNGYFFRREHKFGESGISERELFSGGSLSANDRWKQYVSEELLEWFDLNGGRQTFNQYKTTRRDNDRAERHQYEEEQAARAAGAPNANPDTDTSGDAPEGRDGTDPAAGASEGGDAPGNGTGETNTGTGETNTGTNEPSTPTPAPVVDPDTPRFANLDAVRDHLRSGQVDAPDRAATGQTAAPPDADELRAIADDPNTALTRGRRLLVYGNQATRESSEWNGRYRIAAPGSMLPVVHDSLNGFRSRKDALRAANALEANVRDAEGRPFLWDAPDAAERARAFQGPNGETLADTITRVLSDQDPDRWDFERNRSEERANWRRQADEWHRQQEADGYTVLADPADLQPGDEVSHPVTVGSAMRTTPGQIGTNRATITSGDRQAYGAQGIQALGAGDSLGYPAQGTRTAPDGQSSRSSEARPEFGVVRRKPRPDELDDTTSSADTPQPDPAPEPNAPTPDPEPTPAPAPEEPEAPAAPAAPADEPEGVPDPIDGQTAHWARVADLNQGDMVRISGTTRNGRRTERAGYAYNAPVRVEVTRRGRTEEMLRTWITANPDGTGPAANVYTPMNASVARADAPDSTVPGSPASGAQAALRTGALPDQIPVDRNGRGLFPGSTVTAVDGLRNREGTITGASSNTVSVHWAGGREESSVSPTTLTATHSQRPDGWTSSGQRVTTQHVVSDSDGALLGTVDDVDGDDVTINTANGPVTRSAADLRVTGHVTDDAPDADPVTGIDEPAAADLKDGDVVVLDLDGNLTTVAISGTPKRDGDRVTIQYADTSTGEMGELDVDANAVLPRAQGADGNAPALGPDNAPAPDDDLVIHEPPQRVDPVTGPTVDPDLNSSDRTVIGDHAQGPDDNEDAHQAAVRITSDLPVTPAQASALAEQLRASADPSTTEGRAALRAADHLDRASGQTPPAGLNRPRPSNAAQVSEGDLVAMPDERDGDQVHVYRVIDVEEGPGGVRSFLLEDENQQWKRRIVHGAMPVWQLPEAEPDPVDPPDPDDGDNAPAAPNAPSTPSAPATPATPDAPALPVARVRPGSLRNGDVIDAPVSRTGYQFNGHRRLTIIGTPQRNGWWMQLTGMDEDGNVHDFGLHNGRSVNVYDRNRPTPALPPAGVPRDPNPAPQSTADRIVADHHRTVAARIIDEAIAGTEPPGDIHALREGIAQRLAPDALVDARNAARQDALDALDAAGITGPERAAAVQALKQARNDSHKATVRAALRTINDLEPLPDESNEDLAKRAADLLRLIPDQITNPRPDTGGDGDGEIRRAITGHTSDALNALAGQLQAAGVDPGDAERIARTLAQQLAGSRQVTAARIARRVAAVNPDAARQPGLIARIVALLVRMTKRLTELVKEGARKIAEKYQSARERLRRLRAFLGRVARRVRHFPESRRLARMHRAVNLPDADGNTLAARISHWAGLMPEPGRFGHTQRRVSVWRPTTWGHLAAGRLPDRSDRIQWAPDRTADGGPGLAGMRHLAALRAAGSDVDSDVTRRLAAALGDDFGDDPHATLQHADDYVATSERRLVNLQAARSSATIPDDEDLDVEIAAARMELQSARREYADLRARYAAAVPDAVAASLADIRDMGPDGSHALVFGPDSNPDAERAVRGVQRLIPRAWLNTPEARRVTAVDGSQGRYEPDGQRITVADLADDGLGTAGHALAQHFAQHLGDLDAAQRAYWFTQTHTGRPGARRMRPSVFSRILRRQQTQPQTGDTLARSIQAMFSGDWYQDDDLRAFLLGLMATR